MLYFLGGISDVLDGMAARHFGKATEFGARLDTAADMVFTPVVSVKIMLAVRLPRWMILWIVCIAVIKCLSMIGGLIRRKRFIPEHTIMNKICGGLIFIIPLYINLLPQKTVMNLLILTCAAATAAAVQEGYYIRKGKEIR